MGMESNGQSQDAGDKAAKTNEDVVAQDKSRRRLLLFAVTGAALVLLAAIIACVAVFGDSGRKLQEQLDLGAKYLEEMDYEQALMAFNTALEIEPKNADAYLGIVEVYIRTNEFETALEYAREGYGVTGDERLKEKIDMIESGDIFASNGRQMRLSGYDGDGNLVYWHEFTYNLQGQRTSVAKYNAQGVQEQYLELSYDEEGRVLTGYHWISTGGDLLKIVTEYSGNNYRETVYEGISDEIDRYSEVEVDTDGKILKKTEYDTDGSVRGISTYEYDEGGKIIRITSYNADNELTQYVVRTYDEKGGGLQQQQTYNRNGELTAYTEYVHDDEGHIIGSRYYDANGVLQSEIVEQ